jgi:hypothetical protein
MDKKNTGLIATIATALLCGCPGLISLCMGAMFAIVGTIPGSDIDIGGSSDPAAAIGTGIAMLCGGVLFIAIPIVVGFVTLRKKPEEATPVSAPVSEPTPPVSPAETVVSQPKPPVDDEPLPPAS